jgi:hypothetical protein
LIGSKTVIRGNGKANPFRSKAVAKTHLHKARVQVVTFGRVENVMFGIVHSSISSIMSSETSILFVFLPPPFGMLPEPLEELSWFQSVSV